MAELPTKEDFKKLFHKKGHDALVWYAWRSVLRALPVFRIAKRHRSEAGYVFSLCQVVLLLAQWINLKERGIAEVIQIPAEVVRADFIRTAARVTYAAIFVSDVAASAVRAAVIAASDPRAADAAVADYVWLMSNSFTPNEWLTRSLWGENPEPEYFRQQRRVFTEQLRELGLGFMADDLDALWENKQLGVHAKNYLLGVGISAVELNDPDALRRLILKSEVAEHIHAVRVLLLGPGGRAKVHWLIVYRVKQCQRVKN